MKTLRKLITAKIEPNKITTRVAIVGDPSSQVVYKNPVITGTARNKKMRKTYTVNGRKCMNSVSGGWAYHPRIFLQSTA